MSSSSNIIPNQPTGKYKRVDVPVGERKTLAEKMFGYRQEPIEHDTYSYHGDKFYGRPHVGQPPKGDA